MAYKFNYITLVLSLCMLLTACKEDVVYVIQNPETPEVGEKTPIELSVGGVLSNQGIATRASSSAVITQNETDMINFPENTNIFMVMESEYDTDQPDFGGSREKKTTVTRGYVAQGTNAVTFDGVNQRYWDDAHARSSQMSIWAYAQMYKTNWTSCTFQKVVNSTKDGWDKFDDAIYFTSSTSNSYDWNQGDVYPGIKYWSVTHNTDGVQDGTSILCQDLLFSNNIANNTDYIKGDNRLKFDFSSRKFPENPQLYFRHAMSKITIHIKEGDGFIKTGDKANSDFKFTPNTSNVKLTQFNTKGVFNIKEGEFQWVWPANEADQTGATAPREIPKIYQHDNADAGDAYTLEALAIPNIHAFKSSMKNAGGTSLGLSDLYSRFVKDAKSLTENAMMEFTIDNNTYKITSGALYDALMKRENGVITENPVDNATKKTDKGTYIPLEAGKNYVFTFTVSKKKIDNISAQVADWETVEAENVDVTNARINLLMEERGSALAENSVFSIYRKAVVNDGTISDSFGDSQYDWTTGFTGTDASTTASYVAATTNPVVPAHWATSWYWPNNLTFYHLRSLGKATVGTSSTSMAAFSGSLTADASKGDYASISSNLVDATDYVDVCWGAPFTDDDKDEEPESFLFEYNKDKGFAVDRTKDASTTVKQLYHAVGSTKDAIKLIMFHMMSEVKFTVTTTAESEGDHVDFGDGSAGKVTKFELVGFKKDGLIRIGSGLVVATSSESTAESPFVVSESIKKTTNYCTLGAVPQDLTGVKLVITTADHNKYEVALKDLVSTVTSNVLKNPYSAASTTNKYKIDRWYPGFRYNYTFKLTKKGIDEITATVVNWEEVSADEEGVQIQ